MSKSIAAIACFSFATFTWVFFRATSFQNAAAMFTGLINTDGILQIYSWTLLAIGCLITECIIAVLRKTQNNNKITSEYIILDLTKISNMTLFLVFAGVTVLFAYIGNTAFIYGNF